jgi:quercetin dioxygenase-like cupin family protein
MQQSRRNFCFALSAALASTQRLFGEGKTLPSRIYEFGNLPARTAGNVTLHEILEGPIFEGCHISLHESDLAPHSRPHPPHRHRHEEMVFVVEGTLEFTINGKTTRAGEGSVLFAGSNDEHGISNPESTHAKYFVLALGS